MTRRIRSKLLLLLCFLLCVFFIFCNDLILVELIDKFLML